MDIMEAFEKRILFFDGAMGSVLQTRGLKPGEQPERWNISHPEEILALNTGYYRAGANVINTNTFGANPLKFRDKGELKAIIEAGAAIANKARKLTADMDAEHYIVLDIGPTGKLLEPIGDLSFEAAYDAFAYVIRTGAALGVDAVLFETMNDGYESKAAVLAAKENCDLPVFVTNVYDGGGKLLSGADAAAVISMLEGLGVAAVGMNCGLGPKQMIEILPELLKYASVPVIVNPNAGLPREENGRTIYDIEAEEFASYMERMADMGAAAVGGCCGTTFEHISALTNKIGERPPVKREKKRLSMASSFEHAIFFGEKPIIIGERINPTGKPLMKQAIEDLATDFMMSEAVAQEAAGADAIDINVGLPGADEKAMLKKAVADVQGVAASPIMIDTSDTSAMEAAMRIYNGKPIVNSVSGKKKVMDAVFPLVKKYGGVVVGLALDEGGIPETAEKRAKVAEKIYEEASRYGIDREDILIDPLAMAVSADRNAARVALDTIGLISAAGGRTIIGASNISFGLPEREEATAAFIIAAFERGLSAAIADPCSERIAKSVASYKALKGYDENCAGYISLMSGSEKTEKKESGDISPEYAVLHGLRDAAREAAKRLLETEEPMDLVNGRLIPALDEVGRRFEEKTLFLPQLLMSAEAAKAAFSEVNAAVARSGGTSESIGSVILATVKGDIHDIGKNIVKAIVENYGFTVIDLGKDVDKSTIVEAAKKSGALLVGLSALMTTTVPAMAETIEALRESCPGCRVAVGGAVMNAEYAKKIGADFFCKDAMATVAAAKSIYGGGNR